MWSPHLETFLERIVSHCQHCFIWIQRKVSDYHCFVFFPEAAFKVQTSENVPSGSLQPRVVFYLWSTVIQLILGCWYSLSFNRTYRLCRLDCRRKRKGKKKNPTSHPPGEVVQFSVSSICPLPGHGSKRRASPPPPPPPPPQCVWSVESGSTLAFCLWKSLFTLINT